MTYEIAKKLKEAGCKFPFTEILDKSKKWEDLDKESQEAFIEYIKKNENFLRIYKIIMENNTCFMCRYIHKGWSDLDFHIHSTHGIPSLYDLIKDYLNK